MSTGQHGDDQLWHHRHVNRHHVARYDAKLLERIGKPADFIMQLSVCQCPLITWFTFPQYRDFVFPFCSQMGIETIVGDVGFTTDKPFGERFVPFEHIVVRFEPVQFVFGQDIPECREVLACIVPHFLVGLD